eukprot:6105459-Pyramimonas_sp.AAC.1
MHDSGCRAGFGLPLAHGRQGPGTLDWFGKGLWLQELLLAVRAVFRRYCQSASRSLVLPNGVRCAWIFLWTYCRQRSTPRLPSVNMWVSAGGPRRAA